MILYVLRYWPTLSETFVYREIAGLRERGVPVEVLAMGTRDDGRLQDELPEVIVHRPPRGLGGLVLARELPGLRRGEARWLLGQQRPKDVLRALWLARLARRRGAARLHAHFAGEAAEWARTAAAVADLPYSVTAHAVDLYAPRPGLDAVLAGARPLITVCRGNAEAIAARGHGCAVIRSGVRPQRYPIAAPDGPGCALVSVARWTPKKGLDLLLTALERVPEARLHLVSDAPVAAQDRLRVGSLPPSGVPAALAAAHAFVLPCRVAPGGDRDALPVAVLEAMAAGLPVVTTPVGGLPDLVDEAVGWMVPPDDLGALVEVLREVAARPDERARRGRAARDRILDGGWTLERQLDELLAAWGLDPRGGAGPSGPLRGGAPTEGACGTIRSPDGGHVPQGRGAQP